MHSATKECLPSVLDERPQQIRNTTHGREWRIDHNNVLGPSLELLPVSAAAQMSTTIPAKPLDYGFKCSFEFDT